MNKLICRGNSHIFTFFAIFAEISANFLAKCLFGKVAFQRNGFSAKWFSAKCRASKSAPLLFSTQVFSQCLIIKVD